MHRYILTTLLICFFYSNLCAQGSRIIEEDAEMFQPYVTLDDSSKLNNLNSLKTLSEYYALKGDYKNAYKYRVLFENAFSKLSMTDVNNLLLSQKQALKQQLKHAELQISHKNEQIKKEATKKQYAVKAVEILLALGIISIISFLLYGYSKKSKHNRVLRELNRNILESEQKIAAQAAALQKVNEHISDSNLQLEKTVKSKTEALAMTNQELDRFLYKASHDLQGPVATLTGLCQVASMIDHTTESKDIIDRINNIAGNMGEQLQKLRRIHDIQYSQSTAAIVDLSDVYQSVSQRLKERISNSGIQITTNFSEGSQTNSIRLMLEVIMFNLLENALVFKSDKKPQVYIKSFKRGDVLILKVEDNGIGISADLGSQVFEMFFKGSEVSEGHGLGLYMVQKAISRIQGDIHYRSENGYTTFEVVIPDLPKSSFTETVSQEHKLCLQH
ncbi:HAMP domain-containing sensor histidine kinase [Limibacter armeniacum]|uniref:sensor histidine kinase n=1 Tax=Limibacter armeniacum TaxID=466084 RepID=UPI002FE56C5B